MEVRLAKKLGVSRTPIREAIRKLELEGLVLMIPRRGAEVAEITEKSMRDVLEVRRALEVLAVSLSCDRISGEQIEALKEAAEEFDRSLTSDDVTRTAEADVHFHDIIYRSTDNQRLIQLLSNLGEQMYRYRVEYLKHREFHPQISREHKELISYLEAGQKGQAEEKIAVPQLTSRPRPSWRRSAGTEIRKKQNKSRRSGNTPVKFQMKVTGGKFG